MWLFISQFIQEPKQCHWEEMHACYIHYIKGAQGKILIYKKNVHIKTKVYTDVNYAGNTNNRQSISWFYIYIGGSLVTWKSKKQSLVARSSYEAKYKAIIHTTWLKNLFLNFNLPCIGQITM